MEGERNGGRESEMEGGKKGEMKGRKERDWRKGGRKLFVVLCESYLLLS